MKNTQPLQCLWLEEEPKYLQIRMYQAEVSVNQDMTFTFILQCLRAPRLKPLHFTVLQAQTLH